MVLLVPSACSVPSSVILPVPSVLSDADMATIRAGIRTDDAQHAVATLRGYGGFVREGLLYLPNNRGVIKLLPGDVVIMGTPPGTGWRLQPPRFLRPGDRLSLGIAGLGEQNPMVTV